MRWMILAAGVVGLVVGGRRWLRYLRSRLQQAVQEEATRERLRFLQRLDHELKNPLTALQVGLANLEATADQAKREEIGAGLRVQVRRMNHLIGDLRKLAALEKGPIELHPIDTRRMLDDIVQNIRDGEDLEGRRFAVEADTRRLPVLTGDRDLLELAIYNVLDNAIKFTRPGDSIQLHAHTRDDRFIIEVIDTGRGIPAADLPHVWKELYRSQHARDIAGSGIGLAMVHSIIEKHGGEAAITSRINQGTRVILSLPVA